MQIDIVLFWFMNDWGKYGRAYEKIAEQLSKKAEIRRVLCIFPPSEVEHHSIFRPFEYTKCSEKLFLLTPDSQIIINTSKWPWRVRKLINDVALDFALKRFIRAHGFSQKNTILWVFPQHPYIYRLISLIPHRLLITQVVDNNVLKENQSQKKRLLIQSQYEYLSHKADITITSSKLNYDLFSKISRNCYFFENAVDRLFISKPSSLPCTIRKNRPRLGYVGCISERTDIVLLDYVAKHKPEYDLVLAGPQEEKLDKYGILNLPNVTYEGCIPYNKVPEFLRTMDICLIPHKDTLYSRSMSPLKLFQYLGSGRPIVSTDVAGVKRWSNFVSIACNYQDFVEKIDEVLRNDSELLSLKRIEAAKLETWDKRVNEIFDTVMKHF